MYDTALGATLAFLAGVLFGAADAFARAGALGLPLPVGVLITLVVGLPLMLAVSLAVEGVGGVHNVAALAYAAAGLLNFVAGRSLLYASMKVLGASSGSVAVSPAVVLSALLSWASLGEKPPVNVWAPLALVTFAVLLAGLRPSGLGAGKGSIPKGLLCGIGAATALASATVLVRYAAGTYGRPLTGAVVSYATALAVLAAYAVGRGYLGRGLKHRVSGAGCYAAYMVAAGCSVALAQLFRYKALSLMPVASAVILISLFPLHTAYFSLALRASMDRPTARHFLAGCLSAVAVALAYS